LTSGKFFALISFLGLSKNSERKHDISPPPLQVHREQVIIRSKKSPMKKSPMKNSPSILERIAKSSTNVENIRSILKSHVMIDYQLKRKGKVKIG
jgi:hypothetical protein